MRIHSTLLPAYFKRGHKNVKTSPDGKPRGPVFVPLRLSGGLRYRQFGALVLAVLVVAWLSGLFQKTQPNEIVDTGSLNFAPPQHRWITATLPSSSFAFVTLLSSDAFLPGLLVLLSSLRNQTYGAGAVDAVVLVLPHLSVSTRSTLLAFFPNVRGC
jgi:hypothetical protein